MGKVANFTLGILLSGAVAGNAQAASPAPATHLSVMSYNVHDLPWPLATGRPAAMAAIAARLRVMRHEHRQPEVIAMQEAFGDDAKAIGRAAGYRYMAVGPLADDASMIATSDYDRTFIAAGSFFAGERMGKRLDSGLVIFSDYPIVAVHWIAYPVCAGYDCLANKGALAATIVVPGGQAVTVLDTHLNSGNASGVDKPRRYYAYGRQMAQFAAFAAAIEDRGQPLLLAGDFNVGHDPVRSRFFAAWLGARLHAPGVATFACRADPVCSMSNTSSVAESLKRAKDWLLYRASASVGIRPAEITAPFGFERDGTMLSDHIGIAARYLIEPVRLARNRLVHAG